MPLDLKKYTWVLLVFIAYLIQKLRSFLCLRHINLCCFTYRTYLIGGPMFYKNLKDVYKPNGMQLTTHLACYLYNLCDTFKKLILQIKHLRLQTTKSEKNNIHVISPIIPDLSSLDMGWTNVHPDFQNSSKNYFKSISSD